ncbi:MAG: glutathione S-transferase family protein [Saccharospirillaceae bacterium]|nr:glutathione S-transferase family protein [Colwellia sp.]NRB77314.1 glutathione S-transferase family protein [Saccharospirillaceae bacterium]
MSKVKSNWKSSIKDGEYRRKDSQFRNWITADGSAGPTGNAGFTAEAGRYHLYVSLACPWAHRTLIFRQLKGLESLITISVVHPDMLENGWSFEHNEISAELYGTTGDKLYSSKFMFERYFEKAADYTGAITVPVLWDKKLKVIVNNESSEIIRMFNAAFNELTGNDLDFYPQHLKAEIDEVNELVYNKINNGVYKAGFASTQDAYNENVHNLFDALQQLDNKLAKQRYLTGNKLTEADWRLWTTLVRFDSVYHTHFKCNLQLIKEYNNLYHYMLELYQMPNIAKTVNMAHIKRHYYASHQSINPYGIVPMGHNQDWSVPHHRELMGE